MNTICECNSSAHIHQPHQDKKNSAPFNKNNARGAKRWIETGFDIGEDSYPSTILKDQSRNQANTLYARDSPRIIVQKMLSSPGPWDQETNGIRNWLIEISTNLLYQACLVDKIKIPERRIWRLLTIESRNWALIASIFPKFSDQQSIFLESS